MVQSSGDTASTLLAGDFPEPGGSIWAPIAGAFLCAIVGIAISAWPHLASSASGRGPAWVADQDEMYYLAIAMAGVREGFPPRDPVRDDGGRSPYPWLPLWPGAWTARAFGLGPWAIPILWRALGGAFVGASAFLMLRVLIGSARWALPLALLLIVDGGVLSFRPIAQAAVSARAVLAGTESTVFASKPVIHPEWRVATPCLTAGFLFLHVAAVAWARGRPAVNRRAAWIAGGTLGVLVWSYFYYWTAAVVALAVAWLLDRGGRGLYARVLLIGMAIGLPSIASDALLRSGNPGDWQVRTDKFVAVGRMDGVHWPRPGVAMAAVGLAAVALGARRFAYPWALGAVGLAMMNHQMITGLQVENFHWMYAAGPMLATTMFGLAGAGLAGIRREGWRRRGPAFLGAAAAGLVGANLWLRHAEVTRSREPAALTRAIAAYREDAKAWPPGLAGARLAGEEIAVDAACINDGFRPLANYWIWMSLAVTDDDWHDRIALNGALIGQSEAEFLDEQRRNLGSGFAGDWRDDPERLAAILERRRGAFVRHAADPAPGVALYRVRYVLRRAGGGPPPGPAGFWVRSGAGAAWDLWEVAVPAESGRQTSEPPTGG